MYPEAPLRPLHDVPPTRATTEAELRGTRSANLYSPRNELRERRRDAYLRLVVERLTMGLAGGFVQRRDASMRLYIRLIFANHFVTGISNEPQALSSKLEACGSLLTTDYP